MKFSLRAVALGLVALIAGAATAYYSSPGFDSASASPPKELQGFYDLSFPDATGKPLAFKDYRGKIVVVNFWATWCVPCVQEIPELSRLQTEYKSKNVEFVGIGIDNASNIQDFQKKVHASYPLLVGGTASDLVTSYGDSMGALPYTLVLDQKGVVRGSKLGPVDVKELRGWLNEAGAVSG